MLLRSFRLRAIFVYSSRFILYERCVFKIENLNFRGFSLHMKKYDAFEFQWGFFVGSIFNRKFCWIFYESDATTWKCFPREIVHNWSVWIIQKFSSNVTFEAFIVSRTLWQNDALSNTNECMRFWIFDRFMCRFAYKQTIHNIKSP